MKLGIQLVKFSVLVILYEKHIDTDRHGDSSKEQDGLSPFQPNRLRTPTTNWVIGQWKQFKQ